MTAIVENLYISHLSIGDTSIESENDFSTSGNYKNRLLEKTVIALIGLKTFYNK